MGKDQQATSYVTFSVDEGRTWNDYYFSETPIEIYNINEIVNNSLYIYGRDSSDRGVIIGLDMSGLFEK